MVQEQQGLTPMKKAELEQYRKRLRELHARLSGDIEQLADEALNRSRRDTSGDLSSVPIHMADIGSDNFEQDFTLSLLESEEATLEKIDAALVRIEEGTYGQCLNCGVAIPRQRLRAIPYVECCVECAKKQEQGEELGA